MLETLADGIVTTCRLTVSMIWKAWCLRLVGYIKCGATSPRRCIIVIFVQGSSYPSAVFYNYICWMLMLHALLELVGNYYADSLRIRTLTSLWIFRYLLMFWLGRLWFCTSLDYGIVARLRVRLHLDYWDSCKTAEKIMSAINAVVQGSWVNGTRRSIACMRMYFNYVQYPTGWLWSLLLFHRMVSFLFLQEWRECVCVRVEDATCLFIVLPFHHWDETVRAQQSGAPTT